MPVTVVTDSTAYLPPAQAADAGIEVVSLLVRGGEVDGERREADIVDYRAFYEGLRSASTLPTTSQPSIGDFLAVYEPLVAAGHDLVSVHISGGISGTIQSARQAAEEVVRDRPGRRVEVVDSAQSCGGLAMIALAGAACARGGAGIEAVHARVTEARAASRIWFAVDTLEYLRRGGRIGTAQAWVGGALKIKPILTLADQITPIERVRTAGRAFERMRDYLNTLHDDGADAWAVQHIQDSRRADDLIAAGRELFGTAPILVSEVGPVIGAHVGPGLLGVGGMPKRLLQP